MLEFVAPAARRQSLSYFAFVLLGVLTQSHEEEEWNKLKMM